MTTLKNKLVDKLGRIPEQVRGNLYRNGHSFYTVAQDGCTIRNTERQKNQYKLSWDDSLEAYDWVDSVLSSDDPAAKRLAEAVAYVYRLSDLEITSVGIGDYCLVALGDEEGYTISITWKDGYYCLASFETGDEYHAGTAEGAVARAAAMYEAIKQVRRWEA